MRKTIYFVSIAIFIGGAMAGHAFHRYQTNNYASEITLAFQNEAVKEGYAFYDPETRKFSWGIIGPITVDGKLLPNHVTMKRKPK